jgi:hypothetical protein
VASAYHAAHPAARSAKPGALITRGRRLWVDFEVGPAPLGTHQQRNPPLLALERLSQALAKGGVRVGGALAASPVGHRPGHRSGGGRRLRQQRRTRVNFALLPPTEHDGTSSAAAVAALRRGNDAVAVGGARVQAVNKCGWRRTRVDFALLPPLSHRQGAPHGATSAAAAAAAAAAASAAASSAAIAAAGLRAALGQRAWRGDEVEVGSGRRARVVGGNSWIKLGQQLLEEWQEAGAGAGARQQQRWQPLALSQRSKRPPPLAQHVSTTLQQLGSVCARATAEANSGSDHPSSAAVESPQLDATTGQQISGETQRALLSLEVDLRERTRRLGLTMTEQQIALAMRVAAHEDSALAGEMVALELAEQQQQQCTTPQPSTLRVQVRITPPLPAVEPSAAAALATLDRRLSMPGESARVGGGVAVLQRGFVVRTRIDPPASSNNIEDAGHTAAAALALLEGRLAMLQGPRELTRVISGASATSGGFVVKMRIGPPPPAAEPRASTAAAMTSGRSLLHRHRGAPPSHDAEVLARRGRLLRPGPWVPPQVREPGQKMVTPIADRVNSAVSCTQLESLLQDEDYVALKRVAMQERILAARTGDMLWFADHSHLLKEAKTFMNMIRAGTAQYCWLCHRHALEAVRREQLSAWVSNGECAQQHGPEFKEPVPPSIVDTLLAAEEADRFVKELVLVDQRQQGYAALLEERQRHRAASTIAASVRGHSTRLRYRATVLASIQIQSVVRGWHLRVQLAAFRAAVPKVQAIVRRILLASKLRSIRLRPHVIKIQSAWQGHHARCKLRSRCRVSAWPRANLRAAIRMLQQRADVLQHPGELASKVVLVKASEAVHPLAKGAAKPYDFRRGGDLMLATATCVYRVHGDVLAAHDSSVFKAMMARYESRNTTMHTTENDAGILTILSYIYGLPVLIKPHTICTLYALFDRWDCRDAMSFCWRVLSRWAGQGRCCQLYCQGHALQCKRIVKAMNDLILLNFERFVHDPSTDFEQLTHELLTELLRSGRVSITEELVILKLVLRWALFDVEGRGTAVSRLLQMVQWELLENKLLELCVTDEYGLANVLGLAKFAPWHAALGRRSVTGLVRYLHRTNTIVHAIDRSFRLQDVGTVAVSTRQYVRQYVPMNGIQQEQAALDDFVRERPTSGTDSWYLIPHQWISQWQSHVNCWHAFPLPSRIDTNGLLATVNGSGSLVTRPNMVEGEHFDLVSTSVWRRLVQWYGLNGPEIARVVVHSRLRGWQVEVYPLQLLCCVLCGGLPQSIKTVEVSATAALDTLRERCCAEQLISEPNDVLELGTFDWESSSFNVHWTKLTSKTSGTPTLSDVGIKATDTICLKLSFEGNLRRQAMITQRDTLVAALPSVAVAQNSVAPAQCQSARLPRPPPRPTRLRAAERDTHTNRSLTDGSLADTALADTFLTDGSLAPDLVGVLIDHPESTSQNTSRLMDDQSADTPSHSLKVETLDAAQQTENASSLPIAQSGDGSSTALTQQLQQLRVEVQRLQSHAEQTASKMERIECLLQADRQRKDVQNLVQSFGIFQQLGERRQQSSETEPEVASPVMQPLSVRTTPPPRPSMQRDKGISPTSPDQGVVVPSCQPTSTRLRNSFDPHAFVGSEGESEDEPDDQSDEEADGEVDSQNNAMVPSADATAVVPSCQPTSTRLRNSFDPHVDSGDEFVRGVDGQHDVGTIQPSFPPTSSSLQDPGEGDADEVGATTVSRPRSLVSSSSVSPLPPAPPASPPPHAAASLIAAAARRFQYAVSCNQRALDGLDKESNAAVDAL